MRCRQLDERYSGRGRAGEGSRVVGAVTCQDRVGADCRVGAIHRCVVGVSIWCGKNALLCPEKEMIARVYERQGREDKTQRVCLRWVAFHSLQLLQETLPFEDALLPRVTD
jgi:hypothetical protein